MKKYILLLSLFASVASATTLNCKTSVNMDDIATTTVETDGKKQIPINDSDEAISYVSEKTPGVFTLEAYLYNHDMRIYSEGSLNTSLSLSHWTRDAMFEVVCKLP